MTYLPGVGRLRTLGCGSPSSTEVAVVSVSYSSSVTIDTVESSEEISDMESCFFFRLLGVCS